MELGNPGSGFVAPRSSSGLVELCWSVRSLQARLGLLWPVLCLVMPSICPSLAGAFEDDGKCGVSGYVPASHRLQGLQSDQVSGLLLCCSCCCCSLGAALVAPSVLPLQLSWSWCQGLGLAQSWLDERPC